MSAKQNFANPRLLVIPYLLWLLVFLLGPILFVFATSFQTKGLWGGVEYQFTLENYLRTFDPLYLHVILSSLKLAFSTAFSCLIIGYPMAWYMVSIKSSYMRKMLLILVMLPFMSNFVVRAYAVKFLIGIEGPLNTLLKHLAIIDSPLFLNSPGFAVWFGMTTNYLPFMVLPLYVALERFDTSVLEASRDLGANALQTWLRVMWPLTRTAAYTGFMLVFVPALGEFVIPDLMGGARTMYLGNLLAEEFLKARDWPFGSSLSVVMICLIFVFALATQLYRRSQAGDHHEVRSL